MSQAIIVSDELYNRLLAKAQAQGVLIEVYLEQVQSEVERGRETRFRDHLLARGLLVTWPEPVQASGEFKPIEVKGEPLSQTIIEDRR